MVETSISLNLLLSIIMKSYIKSLKTSQMERLLRWGLLNTMDPNNGISKYHSQVTGGNGKGINIKIAGGSKIVGDHLVLANYKNA